MNRDRFIAALGVYPPPVDADLPLVSLDGRSLTLADRWSVDALAVATRRGTPLLIASGASPASDPVVYEGRPWPVVAAGTSPWALSSADLGLLVGATGPADRDGLDEAGAAGLVRRFLAVCAEDEPTSPVLSRSLLDIVPFPIAQPYPAEDVVAAVVDRGSWLELDAGRAGEVLTGIAGIEGRAVGVAASRPAVDQGRLTPAGCARIRRLIAVCERGRLPLISIVDTAGLTPVVDGGQLDLVRSCAAATRSTAVVKIAVVVGRAFGLAATVMGAVGARADAVLPWPRARFALTDPGQVDVAGPADSAAMAAVGRAATEGDVIDVIHPDATRTRLIELLTLLRGRSEYGS